MSPSRSELISGALRGHFARIGSQGILSIVGATLGVGALTVGQPLLAVLADAPEFFVASGISAAEVVLFVVAVLVAPGVAGLLVWGICRLNRIVGGLFLTTLMALLGVLVAANILNRVESIDSDWVVSGSTGIGILFGLAYAASKTVRGWVRVLWVAVPLILAWFVLITPASGLVFARGEATADPVTETTHDYPVVLLVLDELPLATIMNGGGDLLAERFPGFAQLARDGVWYRNATTVSGNTHLAVPPIVSGKHSEVYSIPFTGDHPNSVFTALRGTYDISAVESITSLCPSVICGVTRPVPTGLDLWRGLISDSVVTLGHVLLPDDMDNTLPSIDTGWAAFGEIGSSEGIRAALRTQLDARKERAASFHDAVETAGARRSLVFGHLLFPHAPWTYLEDGAFVGGVGYEEDAETISALTDGRGGGETARYWVDDPWLVSQAHQRHLLSAVYTDRIVAETISRLRTAGTYRDSLVIVVADHGISFEPGRPIRAITSETVGSIAAVPLFVKYPADFTAAPPPGTVSDEPAETIDIVPTIFDVIGAEPPYEVDGVSMLSGVSKTERFTTRSNDGRRIAVGTEGRQKFPVARRVDQRFPSRDPWALIPGDNVRARIGTAPDVRDDQRFEIQLDQTSQDVGANGRSAPSAVTGTIRGRGVNAGQPIAILVNGEVVALTRTYETSEGLAFYGLARPEVFKEGNNVVEAAVIRRGRLFS